VLQVQEGDTLARLAQRFAISVNQVARLRRTLW
jgi:hypothetical protein